MTPAQPRVVLVTLASGEKYVDYARRMLSSAEQFFLAGGAIARTFLLLDARVGWPAATLYRYDVIVEQAARFEDATHIFMIDADMRFVAVVGEEVIAPLVGTCHPGFVGRRGTYEERSESTACVGAGEGTTYFCGGFVGGEREAFLGLAETVKANIADDDARGVTAVWHDESHLNRYLIDHPPDVVLSPSYCYPEDDADYRKKIWAGPYEPKIVALRKPRRYRFFQRLR